ncbi:hypothetical protein KC347_g163 [Hortaea werneckii]|nr:hypothetical protein KC347_g163 [Hortaea werneckii]
MEITVKVDIVPQLRVVDDTHFEDVAEDVVYDFLVCHVGRLPNGWWGGLPRCPASRIMVRLIVEKGIAVSSTC